MDNLLTAVLIFYAIAVTIMLGIAIYLIHKAEVKNDDLSAKLDMYYCSFIDAEHELNVCQNDYAALKEELKKAKLYKEVNGEYNGSRTS